MLLVTGSLVAVFFAVRNHDNPEVDFLNERINKEERALKDTSSNRLLLVGGSNLAFGIDSELLEDESGLKVHNLGLQRGLGLPYMLAQADRVVQPGDKIIFSLEYDFFYEKNLSGTTPMLIMEHDPNELNHFTAYDDLARIGRFFPSFFRIKVNQKLFGGSDQVNPIYNADAFNNYGDVISHLGQPQKIKNPDYNVFELDRANKNLDRLNRWIKSHPEVGCYFSFPPMMQSKFLEYEDEIKQLELDLKNQLNCTILRSATDAAYPDDLFFDTVYHLNGNGREANSNDIALRLNVGMNDGSEDE